MPWTANWMKFFFFLMIRFSFSYFLSLCPKQFNDEPNASKWKRLYCIIRFNYEQNKYVIWSTFIIAVGHPRMNYTRTSMILINIRKFKTKFYFLVCRPDGEHKRIRAKTTNITFEMAFVRATVLFYQIDKLVYFAKLLKLYVYFRHSLLALSSW